MLMNTGKYSDNYTRQMTYIIELICESSQEKLYTKIHFYGLYFIDKQADPEHLQPCFYRMNS